MTFFELFEKDVISTVYTSYPTRSLVLTGTGAGASGFSAAAFEAYFSFYDSGSMPGVGNRTYFDINGRAISQSFYPNVSSKLYFNHALSSSEKKVAERLRNIYFSSSFQKIENYSSSSIVTSSNNACHILSISNILIGSGIKPKSFSLGPITDDGYGGLYSASVLVGCLFYEYGVAYFGYNTIQNMFTNGADTTTLNFSATIHTPMNVYICECPKSVLNFSQNPSYTKLSGTKYEITTTQPQTFVTTIGLYDEDFELVGVAKVSNPIRNKEGDAAQYRLKLNF